MVCGGISRKRELSKMIGKSIPGKREFPDCITGNRETEKWYIPKAFRENENSRIAIQENQKWYVEAFQENENYLK